MKRKDFSVETEFHPLLTAFLFEADEVYREWGGELVVTSGSEHSARHSATSLHYAKPCCAADLRTWLYKSIPSPKAQAARLTDLAAEFCDAHNIATSWLEVILESDHIHVEFQPKRTS